MVRRHRREMLSLPFSYIYHDFCHTYNTVTRNKIDLWQNITAWFYKEWDIFSLKSDFSSLSKWTLPMPETKIWDHFSIQIYPLLVGNMASETTFGHWKVVFSWGKGRKMTFSQNPLSSRFWASGFWMSILSSANFKKDPPWKIFFLSVHAPATSGVCKKQVFIGGLLKIAFNKVSQNKSQRHWTLFLLLPLKANFENLSSKLAELKHSGSLSKEQIGTWGIAFEISSNS